MTRAALAAISLAACGGGGRAPDAAVAPPERVAVISAVASRALDVLFVVDDTTTDGAQEALAAAVPGYLDALAALDGTLPDLHVGVATSSVGVGNDLIPNCAVVSDDGALQGCAGATEAYLTGASPDLAAALACNVVVGIGGCGFEQHLAAMRLALDGANPGFRRPGAHLQVVILADEDDCSASDVTIFDPAEPDAIGPLSSFRCFEHGVRCDGDADPRADGVRASCAPREDSAYLAPVAASADFLRASADGAQVLVAAIVGDPEPVEVTRDPERPDRPVLVASCTDDVIGRADPAVRLAAFAAAFPSRGVVHSICAGDLGPAMRDAGRRAIEAIATTCLAGPLSGPLDALEARCTVRDVTGLDTAAEASTPIPRCTDDPSPPCFRLEPDDRCALNPVQAALVVDRASPPGAGVVTVVDC